MCSAVLAHFILKERLHIFGMVGCLLCLVGSVTIVLHAPLEKSIQSVKDVWNLAIEPGILKLIASYILMLSADASLGRVLSVQMNPSLSARTTYTYKTITTTTTPQSLTSWGRLYESSLLHISSFMSSSYQSEK